MARKRKRKSRSLISAHLRGIKRALLEGEKRPAFLAFLDSSLPAKQGIYALTLVQISDSLTDAAE